jgi:hypothetical protein
MSMSDICWSCGSPLSKRFCRTCGADSGCPSCGEVTLGHFCRSCGFDVAAKRTIPPISPDPTGPDASQVEEVSVVVDEQPKHLDSSEPDAETPGLIGATVVAAAIPEGPVEPPADEESLDQTASDETNELVDKPSPSRPRRKIFVAAAAILAVGLIAGAVVSRTQGSDQTASSDIQEELVVGTAVPTTQPSTTLVAAENPLTSPPSPTSMAAPASQATPGPNSADRTDPTTTTWFTTTTRDPKYLQPFIGDGRTLSYLGAGYICGWDFQAMGGWGFGFDPKEPCNRQFEAYIASNCGVRGDQPWYPGSLGPWTGTIFSQRCDEWEARDLPIYYG